MGKHKYLIVGGIAAAVIVLYLLFKSSQQTAAANLALSNVSYGTSDTISSIFAGLGTGIGAISDLSDVFSDTGSANQPGLYSSVPASANQPGLVSLPTSLSSSQLNSPSLSVSSPSYDYSYEEYALV